MFKPKYTITKDHSTFFEDGEFVVTLHHKKKQLETFCGVNHSALVADAFSYAIVHAKSLGFSDLDLKYR